MPVIVSLHDLEIRAQDLAGELSVEELDVRAGDAVVQIREPARYQLRVELISGSLLLTGELRLPLICTCVRCLKEMPRELVLADWRCLVPLSGDEPAPVVNQRVDLTPWVREDIVLALPQHPLCSAECRGLPLPEPDSSRKTSGHPASNQAGSPWEQLDKLKF